MTEEINQHSGSLQDAEVSASEQSNQSKLNPNKRRPGRPRVKLDIGEIEKLASLQCTDQEMADFCNVDRRTITRMKKRADFRDAIERGKAKGRVSVRRRLFQLAQSDKAGSVAACIFLAKNLLGYRDVPVAEAGAQAETDAQHQARVVEALNTIRSLYGLKPHPIEPINNTETAISAPAKEAAVVSPPKDSTEPSSAGQISTDDSARPLNAGDPPEIKGYVN